MKEQSENPCKKELEELRLATLEWSRAADRCKGYAVLTEISPDTDLIPRSQEEVDQMIIDYKKEEEARKVYFQKVQAVLECQRSSK